MKRMLLVLFSAALLVGAAVAQDANAKHNDKKMKGDHEATIKGCLSGPNNEGVYELKGAGKKRAVEVGGNDELKSHVGHEVALTGMWEKSGKAIGETESKTADTMEKATGEKHFKVMSIKHVADTCTAGGHKMSGMEHGKKGSAAYPPKS